VNENNIDWDEHVHMILYVYHTTFKVTIEHTPFQLVYGLYPLIANRIHVAHEQFTSRPKNFSLLYFNQSHGKIGALG
jgi:hypothetical protein